MKYYQTKFEDYINSEHMFSLHPELKAYKNKLPTNVRNLTNLFIHGPPGTGKYTQALSIISQYSPTRLKYSKTMNIENEKKNLIIHISDIHYEVDLELLGCHAKLLWHDVFFQIIDIITSSSNKNGIILCKNFHKIHTELLDIFYNYIHHYSKHHSIHLVFFFISEHISHVPSSIIDCCQTLSISRPTQDIYNHLIKQNNEEHERNKKDNLFLNKIQYTDHIRYGRDEIVNSSNNIKSTIVDIDTSSIDNIKELKFIPYVNDNDYPENLFDKCIRRLYEYTKDIDNLNFIVLREILYDLLTYDIDIYELLFQYIYLLSDRLDSDQISNILIKSYTSLKYYNNNYRPIYHLENIVLYIINCCYHNEKIRSL